MGLRADKQRAQRRDLLENAFAYMCEHAGRLPTMSELAATCRVSDATVFNYVGQRDALRAEWAHRNLAERCAAVAEEAGGSLRRVIRRTTRDLRAQLEAQPAVWLGIWSAATPVDPAIGRPGGPALEEEDAALVQLLRVAQDRGEVRSDVPADVQASALAAAWLGALAREARRAGDAPPDEAAWRRIGSSVELVLDGLRKRNERVRVGTRAAADQPVTRLPGT